MAARSRTIHWSLRLGQTAFGLILAGFGLLGALLFNQPRDFIADQFDQLAPLARADLLAAPADSDVLIEGRVSARNEIIGHGLVAYASERSVRDIRDDLVWVADEFVTPALVIEMAGGPITAAGNYALSGDLPAIVEGGRRWRGLAPGDEVVVLGRPAFGNLAEQIIPAYIVRGSRQSYPRPGPNPLALIAAAGLIALGGGIMAWLLRQGYAPFGNPKTGRRP